MSAAIPSEEVIDGAHELLSDVHYGFGSDEDDSSGDEMDPELASDEELKSFRKTTLWEGKELPYYDGRHAGPKNVPPEASRWTGLQWFLLLFPLAMLQHVVIHTNLYYLQCEPEGTAAMLTVHELFVWIGLHIKMMMHWSGGQDSYFLGLGSFDARVHMSRRRFYWIKNNLHFNDKEERPQKDDPNYDDCYLVRPLLDAINVTLRKYWKCSEFLSMDEMMIAFKGHNPFHRWIPRKPHPNGFKLHALCDARHYVCVGVLLDDNVKYTIPQIAANLFKHNVKPGMTVVTDRYYTCTNLVRMCIHRKVGFIGSTMIQRFLAKNALPGWSKEKAMKKERGTFEVATNRDRSICCIAWRDKGSFFLTTTTQSTCRVLLNRNQSGRKSFQVTAPYCVQIYDQYFHGVDRNDQLRGGGYGLVLHFKAQKYTIKFFLGILDILLSNAWLYYRWYNPKKMKKHRAWMNEIAAAMLSFNPMNDPLHPTGKVPQEEKTPHRLKLFSVSARSKRRFRATCPMCSAEKEKVCKTVQGCPICRVPLHPACSEAWHGLSSAERAKKKRRYRELHFDDESDEESKDLNRQSPSLPSA